MKALYLRIYVTVVAALLLFAGVSAVLFQRHVAQEREQFESRMAERTVAWAELIQRSLPGHEAPADEQAQALEEWSHRLRLPMALDDAKGQRIGASDMFEERVGEGRQRLFEVRFDDGRTLWVMRVRGPRPGGPDGAFGPDGRAGPGQPGGPPPWLPFVLPAWQGGASLLAVLLVLFVAVAAGAWPVVRRLTRRLEALKRGVETFGAGQLSHRVEVTGSDEVAALASSFNQAAGRIEALLRAHQSLLANASHELRSPLARMKMALAMIDDVPEAQRQALKGEIGVNIRELDALVEEVLLASRLDAIDKLEQHEALDLLSLAAEEASRVDAELDAHGDAPAVRGDERLVRRALRNLLENARRYGGDDVSVELVRELAGGVERLAVRVCDRGPGVPAELRERIFEPFYRLPGHAEKAGGVGLGLSLVRQIAERHGGSVRCEPREGGGSCFVFSLPVAASPSAPTKP
jgi:signal transduction histidine kinase